MEAIMPKRNFLVLIPVLFQALSFAAGNLRPFKREKPVKKEAPIESFFNQMERELQNDVTHMLEMHENLQKMCSTCFICKDGVCELKQDFKDLRKIDIKDETNNIILIIDLPGDMKTSDIKIKANDKELEGILEYPDHKLKFFVKKGKEFGTSLDYYKETKSDIDEKNKSNIQKEKEEYHRVVSSLSTKVVSIPAVSNLENAKVSLAKGKLKLVLPKATANQGSWTDLSVSTDSSPSTDSNNNNTQDITESTSLSTPVIAGSENIALNIEDKEIK